MSDVNIVAVYEAWNQGQSKASLAVQYDVSPRTIGRWIDSVIEAGYTKPAVAVSKIDDVEKVEPQDTRFLQAYQRKIQDGYTTADLAEAFCISESTVRRWIKRAEAHYDNEVVSQLEKGEAVLDKASKAELVSYKYVASSKSISVTQLTGGVVSGSVSTDKSVAGFSELLDRLIDSSFAQEDLEFVFVALQPTLSLDKFSQGKLQIDPKERKVFYVADEDTVPHLVDNSLTTRVIDMVRAGDTGVTTLLNFLEKLMENPSRRAVNELYGFLQANDIEIGEDGDFYAWKKVRDDYLDIHSGTIDNSPGAHPRVARNMVDEDSNRTCSYGLHVCSKSYLKHFGNCTSSRVVKVKVNPADVVAVPADYNNAKMRTAGYAVVEDVTGSRAVVDNETWD